MIAHAQSATRTYTTVTDYLTWDHDRLDAILAEVARMVDDGELERAEHTYREFHEGLARHIRIEEELLFPAFEQRTGITQGPTQVMRMEHRAIREAMDLMNEALAAGKGGAFHEGRELLEGTLPSHNEKEERVLYPTVDRVLAPDDRKQLVDRMLAA